MNHDDGEASPVRRGLIFSLLRELRRGWRCLRRRWSKHGVAFIFGDAYSTRMPGVPHDERRAERVLAFLVEEGLVHRDDIVIPRQPSMRNLLKVHSAEYLDSLQQHDVLLRVFGVTIGDEDLDELLDGQRLMVGGTIQAARLARHRRGVAVNLGGGLHHAHRDEGLSFCIFNDVAVAIARLRARGFKAPVLVVDLDIHDGNGTRNIFAHDPTVHTYSVHNEHWGDTEAVASTAIALGADVSDELYLGTLLKTLPDVAEQVKPGLVVYLAGTDPAADDSLGNWKISAEGLLSRDRFVIDLFRKRRPRVPVVVVLAGGYGNRAWRHTARFMSWLLSGRAIEPPATEELTLRRFHRLRASLDTMALTSEPGDFSWGLSDEDLAGILPGVARRTRFLSYFSRHGIELVLERFGLLDQLRIRGFEHPTVDLDLSQLTGDTLRIYSKPDRKELLVELRVRRDQRVVPGCEVLIVEWLLLQHPRAHFGPFRRPLPGQKHPGLGMLKEVFGCMVMICEILDLDGIFYAPATYHVAAQSRHLVRFVHPEHEARFRALAEALGQLPLAEASQAVAGGRVRDEVSGEVFEWEGFPMILPVSAALKEQVFADTYEQRVAEELDGLSFSTTGAGEPASES